MSKKLFLSLCLGLALVSCKKEGCTDSTASNFDPSAEKDDGSCQHDHNHMHENDVIWIANEGAFQTDGATLTKYNSTDNVVTNESFLANNGRILGSVANDMIQYGSNIYTVLNGSSIIEVTGKKDGMSVAQIQLQTSGSQSSPRQVVADNGNLYISCFDGTVKVVDTTSLSVVSSYNVNNGDYLEGIAVYNGKIYVANSETSAPQVYNNTITVLDQYSGAETAIIPVCENPGDIEIVNGALYVLKRVTYDAQWNPLGTTGLVKVDLSTNLAVDTIDVDAKSMDADQNSIYVQGETSIALFDASTDAVTNASFIDCSTYGTLYGVSVLSNGGFATFDAKNYTDAGEVHMHDANGNETTSFEAGVIPTCAVFVD
jgi:hypothetical protein